MARLARVVVPGVPHHVVQRGNRRQETFFCDDDYRVYKALMAEWCAKHGVEVWAYCLMPNHVHLILVPRDENGLARAVGEAHRRYTRHVNVREQWSGYLWQGRFSSFPMDDEHLLRAAAYVERNPVKAGLARSARQYAWSSAKAHLSGQDDDLVRVKPLLKRCDDWAGLLRGKDAEDDLRAFHAHAGTGRPLGRTTFVEKLEGQLGRTLRPAKRGRKPRAAT
ncbi:MAG: transposase [Alphaproteobacteria bacterium]|nr:transposase [Alphaproteobacteria bacterium]